MDIIPYSANDAAGDDHVCLGTDCKQCEEIAALIAFGDGIHADFEDLHYDIPSLINPLNDIKLVDSFDEELLKTEHVMIKVGDEFKIAEFNARNFVKPTEFLLRSIAQIQSPNDMSSAFVQQKIWKEFGRFPDFNIVDDEEVVPRFRRINLIKKVSVLTGADKAMKDPCMFSFINLVIVMKYMTILEKLDEETQEKILSCRETDLLDDFELRGGMNESVRFYEWFLTLMRSYTEHNARLMFHKRTFVFPISKFPYVMPYVGEGKSELFYDAQKTHIVRPLEIQGKEDEVDFRPMAETTPYDDSARVRTIPQQFIDRLLIELYHLNDNVVYRDPNAKPTEN